MSDSASTEIPSLSTSTLLEEVFHPQQHGEEIGTVNLIQQSQLMSSSNSTNILTLTARESGIHWTLLINSACLIIAVLAYVICLRRMRIFKKRGTFVPKWVSGEGAWAGKNVFGGGEGNFDAVPKNESANQLANSNKLPSSSTTSENSHNKPHLLKPTKILNVHAQGDDNEDEQVEIVVTNVRPRGGSLLGAARTSTTTTDDDGGDLLAPELDTTPTRNLSSISPPLDDESHTTRIQSASLPDNASTDSLSSQASTSPILSHTSHRHSSTRKKSSSSSALQRRHCLSFITRPLYNLWLSIWYEQQYHSFGAFYGHQITLYLFLSKQITIALFMCAFLSCTVLLPIHLSGVTPSKKIYTPAEYGSFKLAKDDYFLVHTTISMVVDQPGKLYVHVFMTLVFVCIVLGFLRRFTESRLVKDYPFEGRKLLSDYSLRLDELPEDLVSNDLLKQACNLPEIFDNSVTNSRITFETAARIKLEKKHRQVCKRLKHYETMQVEKDKKRQRRWWWGKKHDESGGGIGADDVEGVVGGTRVEAEGGVREDTLRVDTSSQHTTKTIHSTTPRTFVFNRRFPFLRRVDAIKYYTQRRIKLEEKMRIWDEEFLQQPVGTGTAYVLFHSQQAMQRALAKGEGGIVRFTVDLKGPKKPKKLPKITFVLSRASEPSDILWENSSVSKESRFTRMVAVNFFIIIYLMIFSSPLALISSLQSFLDILPKNIHETLDGMRHISGPLGDLVYQYMPTLLLLVLSSTLPYVIPVLTSLEKYYTYSTYAMNTIYRLYLYLLLTTLILPSFALTSMDGLLKYLQFKNISQSLQNLFLPGSGVFFVNYCIQYLFWSTIIDLLRIGDVIRYLWRRVSAVGEQEKREAAQVAEFDFPLEYGYLLSFFAITFTYGVFSPLILVLGFTYFLLKYLLDARNIVYLCSKNKNSRHNVMPDVINYKKNIMLLAYIIFSAVLIFELYQIMFYAKAGQSCFVHLAIMTSAFLATVIYMVYWGLTYHINGTDAQKTWRLGKRSRGGAQRGPEDSTEPLMSSAAELSSVELHPMELGNQEAFDLAYVPPFSPIGIELTVAAQTSEDVLELDTSQAPKDEEKNDEDSNLASSSV